MHPYQRRLIAEATKYGYQHPDTQPRFDGTAETAMKNLKEVDLISEGGSISEDIEILGEGISAMGGAMKAAVAAGHTLSTYKNLLNRLLKFPGHALVLDITTPTGPGAARGGLTGEGSEIKVVKVADIGKYELMGYKFPSVKPGAKAERSWQDHKGQATILAVHESVQEETETVSEASDYVDLATKNLAVSTKMAEKKDKKHDSQWGFGYRAYLRAFIKGNASAIKKIDNPEQNAGFIAARKDVASLTPLKEETESLEEAVYHPPEYDYLKLPTNVKPLLMYKHFTDRIGHYNRAWNTFFAADANKKSPDKSMKAADHLWRAVDYGVGMEKAPIIAAKFGLEKAKKEGVEETETNEAFAPNWAFDRRREHPILGGFKYNGNFFEYRAIVKGTPGSDWALSHGMTHEVFLKPVFNDHRDSRFAIIKATVAQVAMDEAEGGKPVYEKWAIAGHKKYPHHPTNPTGLKEGAVKDELDDFLQGLPNAAVTELKTLGDLKGKESKIKAILMKHKAKPILGTKSRKPSMEESVKVIVQWFQSWFEND